MMKIFNNRWTWIAMAAILVVGGFLLIRNSANAADSETVNNETAVAFVGDFATTTSTSGQVETSQASSLSVDSAGIVDEIFVREGDVVSAGESLLQVDTADLEIAVQRAEQSVALQAASLQSLLDGSRAEDIAAAEASVASAQASLDHLLAGPDEFDIAESEANLRSQQASVASASASYNSTLDTITDAQIAQAQINVLNAQTTYDNAVDANEDNPNGSTHDAMIDAYESLQVAQKTLDDLLDGPAQGSIASSAGSLSAANANLVGAEANHNELIADPTAQEISRAEANLAQMEATLANLLEPASDESMAIAEENLRQAELNLLDAQDALAEATLVAPFDGIITDVSVSVGEYASGPVVELVSSDLKVVLEVDEIDIGQVNVGQAANLNLETWPDETIAGTVTSISPSANTADSVVAYDVTIKLGETELPILVGMTANADLITADFSDVLLVPNRAITADRTAGTYTANVLTTSADGEPLIEMVEVTIGEKGNDFTEITSGLNEGDELILGVVEAPVEALQIGPGPGGG